MPMELILASADVNLPQSIENLEALKAELAPKLEKYNNLVVTEDSIKAAKDDKAALNKLKKAIDEQRISIKKQYLEPYNRLEEECKKLTALIDAPIQAIDKQIKAFDEVEKQEKLTQLQTAFYKTDHPNWLQFSNVCPEKWENKTNKTDKLIEQIEANVNKINSEIAEIDALYADSPLLTAIADTYKRTLDKSQALSYAVQLEAQEKERKAKEEALKEQMLKAAAEEKVKQPENVQNEQEQPSENGNGIILPEEQTAPIVQSEQPETVLKGKFKVECTKSQLIALRDFMKAQGIKYELVKE